MNAPENKMRVVIDLEGRAYFVPEKKISRKVQRAKKHHRHHDLGLLPPLPPPQWMAHERQSTLHHDEPHIVILTRKVPQIRHRVRHAG